MAEAPRPPNWRHPLRDAALSEAFLTSLALLLALPLTNPEIVLATGLLNLFVGLNLPRGPLTLLLSHSLFCLSYAALNLKARLAGFDPSLELAAQDLGAPPRSDHGRHGP
jgi:ABC-type spermidine/putrescine transport system permease subunit II